VIFWASLSASSAKITHVSRVIRAACGAVIFDHPYNDGSRSCLPALPAAISARQFRGWCPASAI
jgi:hypothetical protein